MIAEHRQLLSRNLGLGLAQPLGVIEADRGQHGDPRRDRVGRVKPAPESRLDHPNLDPGSGQGEEAGRGCDLKLGDGLTAGLGKRCDSRFPESRPLGLILLGLGETAIDDFCCFGHPCDRSLKLEPADLLTLDQRSF